jgi:Retroviral aspartyl protease
VETVALLKSRNYKCFVAVGLTRNVLHPIMAVLNTGAGPNLIREDLLPKNWEVYRITGLPLPRITNASGRRISARGVVQLHVQVDGLVRRVRFYVTPGLAVPCILGCNLINLHVKAILPKEQKVLLQEECTVAISPGPGKEECSTAEFTRKSPPPSQSKLKLAKAIQIPPRSEARVMVTSSTSGLCFLQNSGRTHERHEISMANGVAEVQAHVPFGVRVINTSNQSRSLPKGIIIG